MQVSQLIHAQDTAIYDSDRKVAQLLSGAMSRSIILPKIEFDTSNRLERKEVFPFPEVQLRCFFKDDTLYSYERDSDEHDAFFSVEVDDEDEDEESDSDGDGECNFDADDEDDGCEDESEDALEDRPTTIALPRLLHTRPLCYITADHTPDFEVLDEDKLAHQDVFPPECLQVLSMASKQQVFFRHF